MRKSLANNSMVAHVWAQQNQDEGYTKNMFFNRTEIYSYGHHFLAGKIHIKGSTRYALINSKKYSVSTAGHLNIIRGAVSGLMPYFSVPCPENIRDEKNALYMFEQIALTIDECLNNGKIKHEDWIDWRLDSLKDVINEYNDFAFFAGIEQIEYPKEFIEDVELVLKAKHEAYLESQTPEALALAEKAKEKRAALQAKKSEESVKLWIDKGEYSVLRGIKIQFDVARIDNELLKTSRGAEVPLKHALTLYKALKAGKNINGKRIGHFRIDNVIGDVVKAGCHRLYIPWIDYAFRNVKPLVLEEILKTV